MHDTDEALFGFLPYSVGLLQNAYPCRADSCDLCTQLSDVNSDERSSPTDKHTQKIAAHVSAYIHHVRTQLKQTIPKAIVHCLVRPASYAQIATVPRMSWTSHESALG